MMNRANNHVQCLRPRGAFTLIELLVVISIIAVLAGILIPAVSLVRAQAKQSLCLSNLRQLSLGLLTYVSEHDGMIPPGQVPAPARDTLGLPYWGMWFGFIEDYLPAGENKPLYWCPVGCFDLTEIRAMGGSAYCSSYGMNGNPATISNPPWYGIALDRVAKKDLSIMLADHWGADNSGSAFADIYGSVDDPGHGGIVSGPRRPGVGSYSIRANHPANTSTDPTKGRVGTAFFSGRTEALRWQDSYDLAHIWNAPNQWLGIY